VLKDLYRRSADQTQASGMVHVTAIARSTSSCAVEKELQFTRCSAPVQATESNASIIE
jgi:hypothetical protein